MQLTLHRKLQKQINNHHLKSITLDIFDTVLLHEYWPASLREYDIALKWLPTLQQIISPKITPFEIFSYRTYAREQITYWHQTLRIDLWLDVMLELLCLKYDISLDDEQHLQLLATLISTEIEFESNNAKPNRALINAITSLKQDQPELKVYFLADSHFTREQINTLLDIFEIKIFNGGVCSSELGVAKQDGKIFDRLNSELPEVDLMTNLHLGDHRIPDYLMPILHDSQAIHYRPLRMRGLRTLVGKAWLGILKLSANYREAQRFHHNHITATSEIGESCYKYGALAAQSYTLWGWELAIASELRPQEKFLIAGNGVDKILKRTPTLADRDNLQFAKELDHTNLLRAFIWLLATYRTPRWDAARMLQLLFHEMNFKNRLELYRFCFTPDYAYSALAVESLTDDAFWQVFLDEIADDAGQHTYPLQDAYETLLRYLPTSGHQPLYFISLVDDGSARLFHEFARLHSITNDIRTGTLDTNIGLTQHSDKISQNLNPRRRQQIQRGNQDAAALLRDTELSPKKYADNIIHSALAKVAKTLD